MSLAAAFSSAQEAALRASTDLAAIVGKAIFTAAPPTKNLPYVLIGEDQVLEDASGCAGEGEVFATVNAWSRPEPPQANTVRNIAAAIIAALVTELMIDGFDCDLFEVQDQLYTTDPDGSSRARLVLHYLVTEQVS